MQPRFSFLKRSFPAPMTKSIELKELSRKLFQYSQMMLIELSSMR